ncbi:RNA-binding protein [Paraburkholderia sp. IMGN_8]|uniref:RNA-binding protein n=1 Tax=Paraburkholderia sp. IMGN_8 TaxID=3136564 RepID=UPI0031019788
MTKLLLQTVESTVSDEDILGFLSRYGFPPFVSIERMAGTGIRPAVLLGFQDLQPEALQLLQARIHQVFWNDHTIDAIIVQRRTE